MSGRLCRVRATVQGPGDCAGKVQASRELAGAAYFGGHEVGCGDDLLDRYFDLDGIARSNHLLKFDIIKSRGYRHHIFDGRHLG